MAVGFPPKYSEEINHVDLNEKQFMALALEAIKSLKWNVGRISKNKIIAYKSMSLASWGEEIIVDIEEHSATISSKCSSLQFIDWGRNRKNVEEFIEVCSPLAETISGNALTNKVQEMISSFPECADSQIKETHDEKSSGFLSLFKFRKGFLITPLIIYINISIFIIMTLKGVDMFLPSPESVLKFGANFRPLTLQGEWWRLLSSCFIHFGIMHLLMNLYALLFIGLLLEPLLGSARFSVAYLLTGLTGSISSLYWHEMTVSAGASGAIFGLYGVFLAMLTTRLIDEAKRKSLLMSIGIFVFYNLMNGMKGNIDNAAHIGGLIAGLFIGYSYYFSLKKPADLQLQIASLCFVTAILVSSTFIIYSTTPNDIAIFQKNLETFSLLEQQAIHGIQFSHKPSTDSALIAIKEHGIPKWNEAIALLNETDKLKVSKELHKRIQLIKHYCELRIRSYEYLSQVLEGKAKLNSIESNFINNELKNVIQEIKDNTGGK